MVELRGSWVGRRPRWIRCVVLPLPGPYPARAETSVITLRGEERRYFPAAIPAPILDIALRPNSAGAPGTRAQNACCTTVRGAGRAENVHLAHRIAAIVLDGHFG